MAQGDLPAVHPQVRALLTAMGDIADPGPVQPTPAELVAERAAYLEATLRLGGAAEPVASAVDLVVPSGDVRLPARLYAPLHAAETTELVVWMHGGGWYVGDVATFDRVGRSLANASGAKVLIVEYRLAPEHRWPVQIADAEAVVRWARSTAGATQLATDPARVALGGDSAGGHLAVVAARRARADRLPPLRALLLAYPALDPTLSSDSYSVFEQGPMLTKLDMARCWGFYLDGARLDDPDVAPLTATDWDGLPPAWIAVAGQDVLRDDGLALVARLRAAGAAVEQRTFEDMVHGFLRWGGVVDAARELVAWLGDGVRAGASRA
ncbi:MAG TPA: alpha/beta hydrolase [Baekduia sp.]|nr:alpha/beta hydrolase [Baekduia sp.]